LSFIFEKTFYSVRPSVRFCLTEEKTLVSLDDAAEKSCGREKNQGRGTMTRHKTLKTLDDIPHNTK
jgi:hypothetical protein